MTAKDGEGGSRSDAQWKTVLQTSGCDRKRSVADDSRVCLMS